MPLNTFLGTGTQTVAPQNGTVGPTINVSSPSFDPFHPIDSAAAIATDTVTSTLFSSRVIAIVLGLIAIAGSILLYLGEDIAGAVGIAKKGASALVE